MALINLLLLLSLAAGSGLAGRRTQLQSGGERDGLHTGVGGLHGTQPRFQIRAVPEQQATAGQPPDDAGGRVAVAGCLDPSRPVAHLLDAHLTVFRYLLSLRWLLLIW